MAVAMIHRAASVLSASTANSAPRSSKFDTQTLLMAGLAVVLATAPFDLAQLVCAVIGAVAYAALQALPGAAKPRKEKTMRTSAGKAAPASPSGGNVPAWRRPTRPSGSTTDVPPARLPSAQPIAPPSFRAAGWDAEVQELLDQLRPTAEGDAVMRRLAQLVENNLRRVLPEVEVTAFANSDFTRGTAFGVAVPEVELVVNAPPQTILSRLQSGQGHRSQQSLDLRKLQKSAIRLCTDRLVSTGGFRFRRSAFRGDEPKVTLLAAAELGIHTAAIPLDLSVNCTTPLYNAALLTECGRLEPRARELVLLVKRWAKDRGICHAAKGHLPPYAWTLLTLYFLQTREDEEGPLLPSLKHFKATSGLLGQEVSAAREPWTPRAYNGERKTVGALFQEFVRFYAKIFDWRGEAVSVRRGRRAAPDLTLPLHLVLRDDGATPDVGITIEDPFVRGQNLGVCLTASSLARLQEELGRAMSMCETIEASLAALLVPWVPSGVDEQEER